MDHIFLNHRLNSQVSSRSKKLVAQLCQKFLPCFLLVRFFSVGCFFGCLFLWLFGRSSLGDSAVFFSADVAPLTKKTKNHMIGSNKQLIRSKVCAVQLDVKKTLVGTSSYTKSFIFFGGLPRLDILSCGCFNVKFPMFSHGHGKQAAEHGLVEKKHHVAFLVHGTCTYVSFEKGAGSSSLLAFYQLPLQLLSLHPA